MVLTIPKIDKISFIGDNIHIDNKEGIVVPFRFNKIQRYFHTHKGYRNIVLKARQVGCSSSILADMFADCITIPHTYTAVVSHETKATQRLLDRVQFYYDTMENPKPEIGAESRSEKTFPGLHSSIYIGTAGARAFGRGDTIRKALLSEIAFYEDGEKLLSGVEDAVPLTGELTLECYDKDTEVLTESGWKFFKDLDGSEAFLTKGLDNKAYYLHPVAYQKFPYMGDMVRLKGKTFDSLVTPNHRVWASKGDQSFQFHDASAIVTYSEFSLDSSFEWAGQEKEFFTLGDFTVPMDTWLEFMGYFLSEGWVDAYSVSFYQDGIFQEDMKLAAEKVASCFGRRLGVYARGHQFSIGGKGVAEYFKNFTKPKRIPRELLSLSIRQLRILFEAYMKGDGQKSRKTCFTVDKELRDGLQELGLKLGYAPSYHFREKSKYSTEKKRNRDGWEISFNNPRHSCRLRRNNVSTELYDNFVYDVALPENHLLMVRRNGKPIWSGNSTANGENNVFHEKWVQARERKSPYKPFFFPWWLEDGYSIPRNVSDPKIQELLMPEDIGELVFTDEELEIISRAKLTENQIRWRRFKINEKKGLFWIEYPENEVDCFIITGDPVFDQQLLSDMSHSCYDGQRHEKGWYFWIPPREKASYVIGADTSPGAPEGSYSAAVVLDSLWNVCATFQGRLEPHTFAGLLKELGKWYNNAEIVVERNFTGYAVLEQLATYGNVYYQRDFTTGKITTQKGWWTNSSTRDLMLTVAKEKLAQVHIWDINLVRQLRSYRYIKLKNKYRETAQTYDDIAMALMMAMVVRKTAGVGMGYRGQIPYN